MKYTHVVQKGTKYIEYISFHSTIYIMYFYFLITKSLLGLDVGNVNPIFYPKFFFRKVNQFNSKTLW